MMQIQTSNVHFATVFVVVVVFLFTTVTESADADEDYEAGSVGTEGGSGNNVIAGGSDSDDDSKSKTASDSDNENIISSNPLGMGLNPTAKGVKVQGHLGGIDGGVEFPFGGGGGDQNDADEDEAESDDTSDVIFYPGQTKKEVKKVKQLLKTHREKEEKRLAKLKEQPVAAGAERPDISKDPGYVQAPDIIKQNEPIKDFLYNGDITLSVGQAKKLLGDDTNNNNNNNNAANGKGNGDSEKKRVRCERGTLNLEYCGSHYKWPRTIPYAFDKSIKSETRAKIVKALELWSSVTCLSFRENARAKGSKLVFTGKKPGCWSNIGRISPQGQYISINQPNCAELGIILHEVGHALGLYHEHQRYDREGKLQILYKNVQDGMLGQFEETTNQTMNTYGFPYEYGSIMHYPGTAFSVDNTTNTMIAGRGPEWQNSLGQGRGLAWVDHETINAHYGCREVCPNCLFKTEPAKKAKCANGGMVQPRDWSRCICPSGFGGVRCNKLQPPTNHPAGCTGKVLHSTSEWQQLVGNISVTDATRPLSVSASCHWRLQAPAKQRVRVEVVELGGTCSGGCFYGSVEIKYTKDFTQAGISVCCESDLGNSRTLWVNSEGRVVLINLYANMGRKGTGKQSFRLRYKSIED